MIDLALFQNKEQPDLVCWCEKCGKEIRFNDNIHIIGSDYLCEQCANIIESSGEQYEHIGWLDSL
jgi:RNase P subunit RPR2